jgi:UDP-GlcNAc3NAcA epimerase
MTIHVLTVVGARPQFIKVGPVSLALRVAGHRETLVHTGQHYDSAMSQVFFDDLGLPVPHVNLNVGSGPHGEQTGRMLAGIEAAIRDYSPDVVLVYGDTNSTMAGALAAVKMNIPVAHVEAGLRSFNRRMPEEINRIVTDAISTLLFAPTLSAVTYLEREGVSAERIFLVGDVMFDAAIQHAAAAIARSRVLESLGLSGKAYVLATIHRAENTDDPARLRAILEGFAEVAATMPVVLPLHPRTRVKIECDEVLVRICKALTLIDPVSYMNMVALEHGAAVIATDSGGVQKEAFFQQVPCVTLRDETEWVELVNLGWNRLCPPTSAGAVSACIQAAIGSTGEQAAPYGDGAAATRIVSGLEDFVHRVSRITPSQT